MPKTSNSRDRELVSAGNYAGRPCPASMLSNVTSRGSCHSFPATEGKVLSTQ